jgi:DNA-binding IclR family transcriptional regulator
VLSAFTPQRPALGLQELHQAVGLDKATILRLVSVLRRTGYVEIDEATEKYRLGLRALQLANAYLTSSPLEQLALPFLRELAQATGQTANLAVLDGAEIVHTAVVLPDRPLCFHTQVGRRDGAYLTGLGKALLAHQGKRAIDAYLAQVTLARRTPATITSKAALRRELEAVRAGALAEDREEDIPGLRCLAAPIRDRAGDVVAAISISGPASELAESSRLRPALEESLRRAAQRLSRRLGYDASAAQTVEASPAS